MHCQFREMEHTVEESNGAGKALSRHDDAGSELLSEIQEVLKGMVEDKIRLQSRATEKYWKELEGKKSKEALLLVQIKAHIDAISQ